MGLTYRPDGDYQKEGEHMSEKEKALVDQIAELPPDVQDKFLLMAQGAAVAVDCAKAAETKDEGSGDNDA